MRKLNRIAYKLEFIKDNRETNYMDEAVKDKKETIEELGKW